MGTGGPRSGAASGDTRAALLDAAKTCLLEQGYGQLSTRSVTDAAGVPLSQIHYHFGSRRGLVLALLEAENARLLARQSQMYGSDAPLWKRWEQACDFLDDDLDSGYVRVLQEMTAAGWSDDEVAAAVRANLDGWFALLTGVFTELEQRTGDVGPFDPQEAAILAGAAFLGAEQLILLGLTEEAVPVRRALRRVGEMLRRAEDRADGRTP
ncbi:TetR/AcrR family transcriptional regulator [Salsipaludibacter albus]|uniref:TetR/AcrR family transcriptional regulator n=1 Tax=Salsipaludibacter albus TaxID=2849650 RepID=UPI001EE46452|nr:TetR/AcrR family transcriptional regulator [Salsipaludibacter albus]MBY5163328.1 TetR/AcrR family transcriptional regulator [Salsipaludibacter albus]